MRSFPSIVLALEDGSIFRGESIGVPGTVIGEVVFNTAMSGYQEVLTDPSYSGQLVVMTSPMIGNTGINEVDSESRKIQLSGFLTSVTTLTPSHHQATKSLPEYFMEQGIVAAQGIDTRSLTRLLRRKGVLKGILTTEHEDDVRLVERAKRVPAIESVDLVRQGLPMDVSLIRSSLSGIEVVLVDFGAKDSIRKCLEDLGVRVRVVPSDTRAQTILDDRPDGVVLSNGPGDPARLTSIIGEVRGLLGRLPLLGICLGHQLLSLAAGAKTYKLSFGHHGINHPVVNVQTGKVLITSQNHNYAVREESLPEGCEPLFRSLYDGSLEGIRFKAAPILSVQFHPEAAPGPHDAFPLFSEFLSMMKGSSVGSSRGF